MNLSRLIRLFDVRRTGNRYGLSLVRSCGVSENVSQHTVHNYSTILSRLRPFDHSSSVTAICAFVVKIQPYLGAIRDILWTQIKPHKYKVF